MRRIYESDALRRDDDPHTPHRRRSADRPQASRWIPGTTVSNLLTPHWIRHRAISVRISTPRTEFPLGATVPFRVTMKNAMPFPITIPTNSPVLWTWSVDDADEASYVPLRDPPEENGAFTFDRGERKRFTKRWSQTFRVADAEWERAEPGTYTIGVRLNVDEPETKGLSDETTIRLVSE